MLVKGAKGVKVSPWISYTIQHKTMGLLIHDINIDESWLNVSFNNLRKESTIFYEQQSANIIEW